MSWWGDLLIAGAIFVVSFFSMLSGSAALLSRPILLFAGLSPASAIGTFRVANLVGRMAGFSAVMQTHSAKMDWKLGAWLFLCSLVGGAAGAEIVVALPPEAVKRVLGALILVLGITTLMKREVGLVERRERISPAKNWMGRAAVVVTSTLSVFTGGAGVVLTYLLLFVYNKSYLSSTPIRKLASFGSALSASILLIIHGTVRWRLMVFIFVAGILGEYFGSQYQRRNKREWVQLVSLLLVFGVGVALLFL